MLKLEKTQVFGWEAAIRGMRNPMNSWKNSDSYWVANSKRPFTERFSIGENDIKLMKSLSKAGNDHAKFLRMINVTVDITAPLYWWKEFDTYKVGTVANSCSTMHKIHAKEFTMDDFSFDGREDLDFDDELYVDDYGDYMKFDKLIVFMCEYLRCKYIKTNDKRCWRYLIQLLPSSYNQKRTVQLNYQVLKSMYFARKDHKLDEWHTLCDWMLTLPYFKEVCVDTAEKHGTWHTINQITTGLPWKYRCSECGCPQEYAHKYCPNCGKAMDLVKG